MRKSVPHDTQRRQLVRGQSNNAALAGWHGACSAVCGGERVIRWCAYCQRFLGETEPFDSYEISHGMCALCAASHRELSDRDIERATEIGNLQADLMRHGRRADVRTVSTLLDRAFVAGVRPVDAVVGLLAPALHELGASWARGEVTVADEHRFSAFAESILEVVAGRALESAPIAPVSALLVNAEGNYHTLGVRIVNLWLADHGVSSLAIYPGLPSEEVASLVETVKPALLGISVALPDQIAVLSRIVEVLAGRPGLRIALGGYAVKQRLVHPPPGTVVPGDLAQLLEIVAQQEITA